jgi:Cu/Ag efflux protein CusF
MKRLFVFVAMVTFALSFAGIGLAQQKKGEAASTGKKPSVYREKVVTGTATVEAVDLEKRMVTLKRADGSLFDLTVGEEVRNLPQVKVGDQVVVKYHESIAIQVTKPGAAEGSEVKETVARAKPGEKPAGAVAKQVTVTATVEKIDRKKMIATLKGPEGKVVDVKVRNPKNLENVKVGDQVVITYTEAVAVSVEKPKKK